MEKYSSEEIRKRIIGLGETSAKKSYYPLLQEKIKDLEEKQHLLMNTVRELEERETELNRLLDEKNFLLQEVNHRVKNNLQIIISLLTIGLESAELSEKSSFNKAVKRIETISMLYQDILFYENYTEVPFLSFLRMLASEIQSDTSNYDVKVLFDFPGEELMLSLDKAIPLALIANEVIINSFTHAFSGGGGSLRLAVSPSGNSKTQLMIFDTGSGLLSKGKWSEATGMTLIDLLANQISAEYSYDDYGSGGCFKIEFDSFRD